jgi:ferrous iron transport protein B
MRKQRNEIRAGLIGNPNCGKTSLFNSLTGLNQHVGNFPGITVDKKVGIVKLPNSTFIELLDFPGCYSLYPNSSDEKVVVDVLSNPDNPDFPDFIIYVVDATDMDRQFLLASQIRDLGIPILMIISMKDLADERGMDIDLKKLEREFGFPIIFYSNITRENLDLIKDYMFSFRNLLLPGRGERKRQRKRKWRPNENSPTEEDCQCHNGKKCLLHSELLATLERQLIDIQKNPYNPLTPEEFDIVGLFKKEINAKTPYQRLIQIHHSEWLSHLSSDLRKKIAAQKEKLNFNSISLQIDETLNRYQKFTPAINDAVKSSIHVERSTTDKIDGIITNKVFGPVLFFVIMFAIFQAIFSWAAFPMDLIDQGFQWLSEWTRSILPNGWLADLIVEGVIAGIGGVMVFIPQIFFLFLMIGVMEEVGYMSRVVYMFDRVMQKFGLNGRSLVSLISGGACAIPAIMAARTIGNRKERLITILVTPMISCSARIPVYTILIGFAVPNVRYGPFNAQGLAFMGLYLLGIVMALTAALVMKYIFKNKDRSYLMLSLPEYKQPQLKNIAYFVKEKLGAFIIEAGKIILLISIILWALASYGPGESMKRAEEEARIFSMENNMSQEEGRNYIASKKIESSYAGHLGKWIEPAIKPLGFDWKIGIALITSFAAREVFVGTMATIYSIGSDSDESSVKNRMATEINYETGEKVYSPATSWSLLLFYVFALQCMSTLAITKRETNSWKWPLIQFFYLGALAYLSSFTIYQFLS